MIVASGSACRLGGGANVSIEEEAERKGIARLDRSRGKKRRRGRRRRKDYRKMGREWRMVRRVKVEWPEEVGGFRKARDKGE
jgi:hypothetical protein